MYRRPSQVQLMKGEFFETALYWAEVVSVRLGTIAEKKVSQQFLCLGCSVGLTARPLVVSYGVWSLYKLFVYVLLNRVV